MTLNKKLFHDTFKQLKIQLTLAVIYTTPIIAWLLLLHKVTASTKQITHHPSSPCHSVKAKQRPRITLKIIAEPFKLFGTGLRDYVSLPAVTTGLFVQVTNLGFSCSTASLSITKLVHPIVSKSTDVTRNQLFQNEKFLSVN